MSQVASRGVHVERHHQRQQLLVLVPVDVEGDVEAGLPARSVYVWVIDEAPNCRRTTSCPSNASDGQLDRLRGRSSGEPSARVHDSRSHASYSTG